MATAIAAAGFPLHVWACRPSSLDALGDMGHVRHRDPEDLAASCDMVGMCVGTDDDVMRIVTGGLLEGLRPGSVLVNHGTGTPSNALRLTEICAAAGVDIIDERGTLTPSIPGTTLDIDPVVFENYRPSYRCLARYMNHVGSDVQSDLLGDDQPRAVARQYQAEKAWLSDSPAVGTETHITMER